MSPKNPAAVALGRKGGKATAEKRTPEQRSAAARKAVEARWARNEKRLADSFMEIDANLKTLAKRQRATRKKKPR